MFKLFKTHKIAAQTFLKSIINFAMRVEGPGYCFIIQEFASVVRDNPQTQKNRVIHTYKYELYLLILYLYIGI